MGNRPNEGEGQVANLEEIAMIHELNWRGLSSSATPGKVGPDRRMVRKHLKPDLDAASHRPHASRRHKIDSYKDYPGELTAANPDLSRYQLFCDSTAEGQTDACAMVTDFLREIGGGSITVIR